MSHSSELERLHSDMIVFSWLSKVLDYPSEEVIESLFNDSFLNNLDCIEGEQIDTYINSFSSREELLLELQKDYTWLCFVSKPRLVPLFESVYKEGKLFQDSTFQIARLYDEAGLKLVEEFKLPPDHITLELEFMSYLIYQELEAIDSGNKKNREIAIRLQKETMLNHLGDFGMQFADNLKQHCRTPFFNYVAGILSKFMKMEIGYYAN